MIDVGHKWIKMVCQMRALMLSMKYVNWNASPHKTNSKVGLMANTTLANCLIVHMSRDVDGYGQLRAHKTLELDGMVNWKLIK